MTACWSSTRTARPLPPAPSSPGSRALTNKPVKYLGNSHWHWDHWYGAEVYQEAFPNLVIITHERTRALMAGPAIAFNQPGLDTQLPGHTQGGR